MKHIHMKQVHYRFLLSLLMLAGCGAAGDVAYAQSPVASSVRSSSTGDEVQAAPLTAADRAWLARIESVMNSTSTFKAHMQQVDGEGKISSGTIWVKRPGQMRLAYDPPSPILMVANDNKIVFRDNQLDQTTVIPVERTPLGLLLGRHISFSDGVTVTGFHAEGGQIQVSVVRTSSPQDGSLTLVFNEKPVSLSSWSVLDAQGHETHVTLSDMQKNLPVSSDLFTLPAQPEE
ncbi:outer membrane lipoprotein carrier protein LolA [Acetobacter thailandicus]|nr:outer membrane lipoprotein carrier protein LolA [Acetobacter thailandicus]